MLIWGWRSRNKTLGEGTFFSPAAGRDAPYRLIEARRWFTLFFIPIIPLKVLGVFVECQITKTTYDPRILENPTNAEFTDQLAGAIREVVCAVATADATVTAEERRLAVEIVGRHVTGYDEATFDADLARVDDAPLDERLVYLSSALSESGKEQVLTAAATIMAADGSIDERDRDAVRHIGEKLGMSQAHIRGVIDTAASTIPT
jgi:tellurite resistance protein